MAKGNSKGYLNSPMYDNTEVDYNENENMINMLLESFNTSVPDLDKPKEVEIAINAYFKSCISKGLRPGNMGLYSRLGLTKNDVKDLIQGRVKTVEGRKVSIETISLIKKSQRALSEFREGLGSAGKLNPATLIFWQKNFDGLEDVQRVDVAPVNNLQAEKTPEELQQIAEQDIPIDAE